MFMILNRTVADYILYYSKSNLITEILSGERHRTIIVGYYFLNRFLMDLKKLCFIR